MKAHIILVFALLLVFGGIAHAKTPDWMTPSEETICDSETGAAYGLCNAFCEAMDCESANAQASATACSKVKAKYTNITGQAFLPCEVCPPPPPGTTCPCIDSASLPDFSLALNNPGECTTLGIATVKYTDVAWAGASCRESGSSLGGVCATLSPNGYMILEVTPDEGSACAQALLASCNPE